MNYALTGSPILGQPPIVEERPEQVQAEGAIAQGDIAPGRVARTVDRREPHVIAQRNAEADRALVAEAGRPSQFSVIGQVLHGLVLPRGGADIHAHLGSGLQVKSPGEADFGHHREADVAQVKDTVDIDGSTVVGCRFFYPGTVRGIQHFRRNREMIPEPIVNKYPRIPTGLRGVGCTTGIGGGNKIAQVSASFEPELKGLRRQLRRGYEHDREQRANSLCHVVDFRFAIYDCRGR